MRRLMIGLTLVCMAALIPLWVRADDRQIAQEIIQQLQKHKDSGELKSFGIDLQVEEGVVLVEGRVSTAEQRKLALETVRRVDGVKQVVNKLTITGKPFVYTKTAENRKPAVKSAYNATLAKLKGTLNRVSQVSTESAPDKPENLDAAAELRSEKDQNVARLIAEGLKAQKEQGKLEGFRVNLSVDQGTVWLEGEVSSRDQRLLVLDVVRHISGVKQVVNELEIRQQAVPVVVANNTEPAKDTEPETVAQPEANPMATATPIAVVTPIPVIAADVPAKPEPAVTPLVVQQPIGTAAPALQPNVLPTAPVAQAPVARPQVAAYPVPMSYVAQVQPAYVPAHAASVPSPVARTRYDHPQMPAYAWPTYASHPNYAAVTYPKQYSPSAWPYIGPFYPYPQVPLGWRKVTLEWDDGWWHLDFNNRR